jgi:hypothetical protein
VDILGVATKVMSNYTNLVTGKTPGALNVLPAIGVYAAIRREKGEPFSFPGGPSFVWESADADLVGQVMVWVAENPQAANEAFQYHQWRRLRMAERLASYGKDARRRIGG